MEEKRKEKKSELPTIKGLLVSIDNISKTTTTGSLPVFVFNFHYLIERLWVWQINISKRKYKLKLSILLYFFF